MVEVVPVLVPVLVLVLVMVVDGGDEIGGEGRGGGVWKGE